jgi:hypothetical protein
MKEIIFLILIIGIDGYFIFERPADGYCESTYYCVILNPLAKINTSISQEHSRRVVLLAVRNIDDLEIFFLYNNETVNKFFNLYLYNTSRKLFIEIRNGSSSKAGEMIITNQWLKELFGRYKQIYTELILNIVYTHLPKINITTDNITEIVKPGSIVQIRFTKEKERVASCNINITTQRILDNMLECSHPGNQANRSM